MSWTSRASSLNLFDLSNRPCPWTRARSQQPKPKLFLLQDSRAQASWEDFRSGFVGETEVYDLLLQIVVCATAMYSAVPQQLKLSK